MPEQAFIPKRFNYNSLPMNYILMQGPSFKVARIELRGCPKCKHGVLEDRVPRGFFVKYLLAPLPLRRYICYSCFKKSYIWHKPRKRHIQDEQPMPSVVSEHVGIPAH
jgi:hypothetical protein